MIAADTAAAATGAATEEAVVDAAAIEVDAAAAVAAIVVPAGIDPTGQSRHAGSLNPRRSLIEQEAVEGTEFCSVLFVASCLHLRSELSASSSVESAGNTHSPVEMDCMD
jgi:hypothetical protein